MWMRQVTCMNDSCLPALLRHVTHMNESCRTYEWVMSHIWMSHVTRMNESCHTYEWFMSRTWMDYNTLMNESWHIYEWVTSHMRITHGIHVWLRHVMYMDKSCHIFMDESFHICECDLKFTEAAALACHFAKNASWIKAIPWGETHLRSRALANCSAWNLSNTWNSFLLFKKDKRCQKNKCTQKKDLMMWNALAFASTHELLCLMMMKLPSLLQRRSLVSLL